MLDIGGLSAMTIRDKWNWVEVKDVGVGVEIEMGGGLLSMPNATHGGMWNALRVDGAA